MPRWSGARTGPARSGDADVAVMDAPVEQGTDGLCPLWRCRCGCDGCPGGAGARTGSARSGSARSGDADVAVVDAPVEQGHGRALPALGAGDGAGTRHGRAPAGLPCQQLGHARCSLNLLSSSLCVKSTLTRSGTAFLGTALNTQNTHGAVPALLQASFTPLGSNFPPRTWTLATGDREGTAQALPRLGRVHHKAQRLVCPAVPFPTGQAPKCPQVPAQPSLSPCAPFSPLCCFPFFHPLQSSQAYTPKGGEAVYSPGHCRGG
uniref:Uncharacterized protein n=1 Tax=Corvus moneduloides TaxID=1196302 RepID=A0A8U7PAG6_CORMO